MSTSTSCYETYADVIPLVTAVRPNGAATTEAFEAAGGTAGVMKQLHAVHEDRRSDDHRQDAGARIWPA